MTDVINNALSDPIIPTIGLALGATAVALWLAAAWWTYRDATHRAGSYFVGLLAAAWIVVSSPFLLPFSLGVYALARPQQTAAQGRSRNLILELSAQLDAAANSVCPSCEEQVDATWLRCPTCATWLAQPCSACGGWSDPSLDICPWCGNEERAEPGVRDMEPEVEDVPTSPAAKRRGFSPWQGRTDTDLRGPRRRLAAAVEGRTRAPARAQ